MCKIGKTIHNLCSKVYYRYCSTSPHLTSSQPLKARGLLGSPGKGSLHYGNEIKNLYLRNQSRMTKEKDACIDNEPLR